jgi:hypothetical protein
MNKTGEMRCDKVAWRDRGAYALSNGLIRLVTLTGGGHIAEFHFVAESGMPTVNPLWIPPWKTIEPFEYRERLHAHQYGPLRDGKLLSGLAGHSLCLDCFGPPSDEEAAEGLSFHGEAPNARWQERGIRAGRSSIALRLAVDLPVAQLKFSREMRLLQGESVAYFTETVTNLRRADHFFHWTQHVTLAEPFLSHRRSYIVMPATRGRTDPGSYDEGKALLASGRNFRWPYAPGVEAGVVDLARPFPKRGLGFVAALLLDPKRKIEFVAAVNTQYHLVIGYCFRRADFPWCAVWDENQAIEAPPWKKKTQAHALEFGASPFPILRRAAFALGPLFRAPTLAYVPARRRKTIRYLAFLAHLPPDFGTVRDVRLSEDRILIYGETTTNPLHIRATGHRALLPSL